MELAIAQCNAVACGLMALAILCAVLSPKVHDGVVIKTGLIFMAIGLAAIAVHMSDGFDASDVLQVGRALLLINLGAIVIACALGVRWLSVWFINRES